MNVYIMRFNALIIIVKFAVKIESDDLVSLIHHNHVLYSEQFQILHESGYKYY